MSDHTGSVRKRRVFYLPGYDPFPPRRYRELYRSEGAAQAALSGYQIEQSPLPGKTKNGWAVAAQMDGATTNAEIEVLVWSDLVRDSMSRSIPATYLQLAQTTGVYIWSGAFRRLMWLRKGPVIAALYPIVMLVMQLLASLFVAATAGGLLLKLINTPLGLFNTALPGALASLLWWPIFLAVTWFMLKFWQSKDGTFYAYYLMHDYAYGARTGGANPPELEDRMAEFGRVIEEALRSDVDEVLVVGHSSGAHLGASILADLVRQGRVPEDGPELSFLSLGQVIPMVSFLPKAHRLRRDLRELSVAHEITWVDVSAPGDGCSFALCDPVAVSGVQPADARWPMIFSAAYTQTLKPETWAALRWKFFRLHFQYLCAFDNLPGTDHDFDYFRVTAGPLTLYDRFGNRESSRSRIDVAASKYTSIAA